jgi:hypothetical protein
MKAGFWIIIVILAAGLGYWAGYDVASKPPKQVTVVKEVPAEKNVSDKSTSASGGYGASAPAPASSGGYGASAPAPASSGGYGASAPAPASSGGYGASAPAPASSGGYGK